MRTAQMLEIHVEELGQHSLVKALLNTLSGTFGSAQYRFVARRPGTEGGDSAGEWVGATFPVMRFQDLDNLTEPNAWLDLARDRLQELDGQLAADGGQRLPGHGPHWWSLTYHRASAAGAEPARAETSGAGPGDRRSEGAGAAP